MSLRRTHGHSDDRKLAAQARNHVRDARDYARLTEDQAVLEHELDVRQDARLTGNLEDLLAHGVLAAGEYRMSITSTGRAQVRRAGESDVLVEDDARACADWITQHLGQPHAARVFMPVTRLPRQRSGGGK